MKSNVKKIVFIWALSLLNEAELYTFGLFKSSLNSDEKNAGAEYEYSAPALGRFIFASTLS